MNWRSFYTLKSAVFLTIIVFFSGLFVYAIIPFVLMYPVPVQLRPVVMYAYDAVVFIPYIISFFGSVLLITSFPEKPWYRKFIIPFSIVTALGILLYIVKIFLPGTPLEWPLVPVAGLLLILCNLSLAPAIALLLYPFVKDMKSSVTSDFQFLIFVSLISAGIAFFIFFYNILPLFDPEFVWSKFWDFNSTGIANMIYGVYLLFGLPVAGGLSFAVFDMYQKISVLPERSH